MAFQDSLLFVDRHVGGVWWWWENYFVSDLESSHAFFASHWDWDNQLRSVGFKELKESINSWSVISLRWNDHSIAT